MNMYLTEAVVNKKQPSIHSPASLRQVADAFDFQVSFPGAKGSFQGSQLLGEEAQHRRTADRRLCTLRRETIAVVAVWTNVMQ